MVSVPSWQLLPWIIGSVGDLKGKIMGRLIDADALENYLGNKIKEYSVKDDAISQCMKTAYQLALSSVLGAPTIDAVMVVRCKDCMYRNPYNEQCEHSMWYGTMMPDEGYCWMGRVMPNEK